MVTIVGGKLTTYRRMAQDTVDHISKALGDPVMHVTERLPLAGTMGWQEAAVAVKSAAARYSLQPDTARRLGLYGAEATTILGLLADDPTLAARVVSDLPYIMAEVVYACRYEMALTLDDVLDRRLRVNFEAWDHGSAAAPAVAALMARELGWDAAEIAHQVAEYRALVGQADAGKTAPEPVLAPDRQDMHS
jgi:glycerol-3-phosphate dehydrogenase